MNPVAITKEGKKILNQNSKFWIVYLKLVSHKITDVNVSEVRENILEKFKNSSDLSQIVSELKTLLNFNDDLL